jgi:hypothetical protein
MSDNSDKNIHGGPILWPDTLLEKIELEYDELVIHVREESGRSRRVRCLGYIGFQMIGFWDEVIVETATMLAIHPFIEDCERRLESLPESGSRSRATKGNLLLEVLFIDSCKLLVCGAQFHYE